MTILEVIQYLIKCDGFLDKEMEVQIKGRQEAIPIKTMIKLEGKPMFYLYLGDEKITDPR